jgi:hypothetical protein
MAEIGNRRAVCTHCDRTIAPAGGVWLTVIGHNASCPDGLPGGLHTLHSPGDKRWKHTDLTDLVELERAWPGKVPLALVDLVQSVKAAENDAWNIASDLTIDQLTRDCARATAHALCIVLGDQERLSQTGVFDP